MKTKVWMGILLLAATTLSAQTNDLTVLLQQGLFEEQASRNLDAAIANYQTLALQFDKDRQLAATAVFRLGECYRAQGRTNEAAVQYQRILHDFSDQQTLVTLSRQNLAGMGVGATESSASATAVDRAREENSDVQLWNKLKDLPKDQLEKVLPTLIPDTTLEALLKQRYEAQAKLVQLKTDYAESHPAVVSEKALLDELNRQIGEKISGTMEGLRLRAELAQASQNLSSTPNSKSSGAQMVGDEDQEIQRIQQMIQNSPDLINASGDTTGTPLVRAAILGHLKVAAYLLDHGADINYPASDVRQSKDLLEAGQVTPLIAAVNAGNKTMVKFLLDHGANVNFRVNNGDTPLHLAARKGFLAVVEVLLTSHADVNAQNNNGMPPLFSAVESGQINIVQTLVKAGADVNLKDNKNRTALNYAIKTSPEMLQTLLSAGTNPNTEDSSGRSPLSYATERDDSQAVKLLLAAKAGANSGTECLPLAGAICRKDINLTRMLLDAGANPNAAGSASFSGMNFEGTVLNHQSHLTPLWLAVHFRDLSAVELLLHFKADPNDAQTDGQSVLFGALADTNVLAALLNAGGAVSAQGGDGVSLLARAVSLKQTGAVQLLLKYKADPNDTRLDGRPLIFSALAETNILEALLNAGAKIELHDNISVINGTRTDWTPLEAAAWQQMTGAVDILLKRGADPNVRDAIGNVALHWAVSFLRVKLTDQNYEMVKSLLNRGADPNIRNSGGYTPLDWVKRRMEGNEGTAAEAVVSNIVSLLRQHGAADKLPDWNCITMGRSAAGFSFAIFHKGTNDWNRFTLLESIINFYESYENYPVPQGGVTTFYPLNSMLPFPDLAHVIILRPSRHSTNETRITVNVLNSTNGIDLTKDVTLAFGDTVEIPERDHALGERSVGLTEVQRASLRDYVKGSAQLVAHGQTLEIPFHRLGSEAILDTLLNSSESRGLLLASSDLSRVKVTRRDPKTGQKRELVVNCNGATSVPMGNPLSNPLSYQWNIGGNNSLPKSGFWLCNGDVIEVPEKP